MGTSDEESFRADSERKHCPRRRIASEHHAEAKNFVETMAYRYGLLGGDFTEAHTVRYDSAGGALDRVGDADVGSANSPDFQRGNSVVPSMSLTFRETTNRGCSPHGEELERISSSLPRPTTPM